MQAKKKKSEAAVREAEEDSPEQIEDGSEGHVTSPPSHVTGFPDENQSWLKPAKKSRKVHKMTTKKQPKKQPLLESSNSTDNDQEMSKRQYM